MMDSPFAAAAADVPIPRSSGSNVVHSAPCADAASISISDVVVNRQDPLVASSPSRPKTMAKAASSTVLNSPKALVGNPTVVLQSELQMMKKLGEGAYAIVEKCKYTPAGGRPPRNVAVKKLKPSITSKEDVDSFQSEITLMRRLNHTSILEYIGCGSSDTSTEANKLSTLFLVVELVEGGTLKKVVMKQMRLPYKSLYTDADALRWCTQIAEAIAYLHDATPTVIHRDLKLENILLQGTDTATQHAKLADFGLVAFVQNKKAAAMTRTRSTAGRLSEMGAAPEQTGFSGSGFSGLHQSTVPEADEDRWTRTSKMLIARMDSKGVAPSGALGLMRNSIIGLPIPAVRETRLSKNAEKQLSGRTGTLMYMAPEMFQNKDYNEKVDVFSFSVIMYELLHRYMMVFAVSTQGTEEEIEQYAEKVSGGWRPPLNERFSGELLSVISNGWAQSPRERPTMSEIVKRLHQVQAKGNILSEAGELKQQKAGDSGCCAVS